MYRYLYSKLFIVFLLYTTTGYSQTCLMTAVNATALPCNGNYFSVSIDLEVDNPSPGFTLAGNGVIYGTFLYSDLPITIGPFLGDDESVYEFIAWDVENPSCQQFTTLNASNCGPICQFSNAELDLIMCQNNNAALVELNFTHEGTTNPAFDVFYENGNEAGSFLFSSLPVTISSFIVNGAEPIRLTICENDNLDCCETFEFDAIDCNPNNCEIYNVNIDPECTGGNFVVHLDFDFTNVQSDSFTVNGNNLTYGTFGYNELPITLGPLNGNTNIVWEFVIRDSELFSCSKASVLGIYNCPPPCNVLSLSATAGICNGDTAYTLDIELDIEGEGDNGFSVFSEAVYYGTFEYDDLPITLPSVEGTSGGIVESITVCDNENPGCCSTVLYEALLCDGCIINNIHAIPQPCNDNNEFMVLLDFYHHNVTPNGFMVSGNGMQFGPFQYSSLPVLVGPYDGSGSQFLEFVVTDIGNGDCFGAIEIGTLGCNDICSLTNLVAETGDCTGSDEYAVTIDFDFENTGGVGFDLFANGEFFAFYHYEDLPLLIENFPSSGNDLDTITVCDNDNPDCCTTLVFPAVFCPCDISEISVQQHQCTSDSTFGVDLNFHFENLPGDFVDVFFNGAFLGFYSVNDLPLSIDNIPDGDGTGVLKVCANDQPDCCAELVIELLNCDSVCNIWDLFAEAGACNSDSTFLLDIVFNSTFGLEDSVLIFGNGQFIGQYQNDPEFIRIDSFPDLGNVTHLQVCAVEAPDCCEDFTFETPDCIPGDCEIWDLVVVPGDCLTDSTYVLIIEYNSDNVPGDSVNISVNGNFIGTFISPDNHIVIEHFPWFDGDNAVLTLCSFAYPDCCDSFEFGIPDCPGVECHIVDLVVNFEGCQTDSTYMVAVNFEYSNLPTDSVIITANGLEIGQFQINEGHILVGNIPVFSTNHTVFTVCAVGEPECCDVYELETPNCVEGCAIDINFIETGNCNTDSTYVFVIDFQYFDLPGDSVIITANGETIGTFNVHEGHILIENFPLFTTNHTVVTICAAGDPECCDVIEFETPHCVEECNIFDLSVNVEDCTSDSTYILVVNFESNDLPGDSVLISANGNPIGQFHWQEGHIVIEHFPVFETSNTVITVCAVGAPECCDVFEFETPTCDGSCDIFELFVETGVCTSDSTFLVDIVFDSHNLPGDSVTIYAADESLGNYFIHPDFIRIEDFPLFDGETTIITVCATNAPDCCASYIIENPDCGGECDIYDIAVDVLDCTSDSTFGAVINFQHDNVSAGGFDVYTGEGYLGFFPIDQIPIITESFPSNSSGAYVVTICESDNLECCESFEFQGPVCGEFCDIFNLEWSITECNEEGNFFFIIDFDFQNVGLEGFNVIGNGNNYGNFSYGSLPIELGPFEPSDLVYEFLVVDALDNTCFDFIEPGMVDCIVSTNQVNQDEIFEVYDNGTRPAILAMQDINLSLFNSNGKTIYSDKQINSGSVFELKDLPSGLFIGTIIFEGNVWTVKLVVNSN